MTDGSVATRIDDVKIVGGGDIGLLTALSIRQLNPDVDVTVIDDFEREIPQVGKSTYREIQNVLHGTLGFDESQFIAEVRPVWKASVYFRDWCGYPEFHYPFDPQTKFPESDTPDAIEHYYYYYDELYDSLDHLTKGEEIVAQRQSPWFYGPDGNLDRYDNVAYHLNTERFNSFLRERSQDRGISLVDDAITGVETTGSHIDRLQGENGTYEADLYVDATGFDRVLRSEQEATFEDFDFPLDRALNVRLERSLEEVIPATIVESGDYGWFWHIDTYDNRDLGYVFASEYVSEEDARTEFLDHIEEVAPSDAGPDPVDPSEIDLYEFSSGYFDRAWVENCLTIGNAEGFVEPLQSTGLTANATAAVRLANLLSGHGRIADDDLRRTYNGWVRNLWESIYDFISIHYANSAGQTAFWRDVSRIDVSPRVERIDESFDATGFDWSINPLLDQPDLRDLQVFQAPDFYTVMRNMGASSEFYDRTDIDVRRTTKHEIDKRYRQISADVEDHLSIKQLYKGIMEL